MKRFQVSNSVSLQQQITIKIICQECIAASLILTEQYPAPAILFYLLFSDDVKSQATGVYTFPASADGQTCNTDVMLDVKHIGNNQACIQVG